MTVRPARRRRSRRRSRKPQPGRQNCFPGRRTTQTFKAETFVREIDCLGGSAGMSPQPATVSSHSTLQLGRARVRTYSKRRDLSHQLISMVGVSEWHELGNTLDIFSPLLLLITSAGVQGPAKSKARGFGRRTRRAYICPSLSRGGSWERGGSTSSPQPRWVVLSTHPTYPSPIPAETSLPGEAHDPHHRGSRRMRYRATEATVRRGK